MLSDAIAEKAMAALKQNDPNKAKSELEKLIMADPDRIDLRHALATVLLRMGEPKAALLMANEGVKMCHDQQTDTAATLMTPLHLIIANAQEDLYNPHAAQMAYELILDKEADHPYAQQRLAYLHLSRGQIKKGIVSLQTYIDAEADAPESIEAHGELREGIVQFLNADIHPKNFILAHREAYVEAFDQIATDMVKKGWYAEAARMQRDQDGNLTPVIPDGARPYAAIRVDLVNPEDGQPGRIGEGPFVVALEGHEVLSQCPIVWEWPDQPFPTWVSSQCPWNNFEIQIQMGDDSDIESIDAIVGDWYQAGYNGAFGRGDQGMLHEISDPIKLADTIVAYYVDCGRAGSESVNELLNRLALHHEKRPITKVLLGKGLVI